MTEEQTEKESPIRQAKSESAKPVCLLVACLRRCQLATRPRDTLSATHKQNTWRLPQLRLGPWIIPASQPEIALLWHFIYYSQTSGFCLRTSVTRTQTHTSEVVFPAPPSFKYKRQDSLFYSEPSSGLDLSAPLLRFLVSFHKNLLQSELLLVI